MGFISMLKVGLKILERPYYIMSYPQIFHALISCLIHSIICFHYVSVLPCHFYIQLETNTDIIPRVSYHGWRIHF